jgi:hypothetical protein
MKHQVYDSMLAQLLFAVAGCPSALRFLQHSGVPVSVRDANEPSGYLAVMGKRQCTVNILQAGLSACHSPLDAITSVDVFVLSFEVEPVFVTLLAVVACSCCC